MGVRIIGSESGPTRRIQPATAGVSDAASSVAGIKFKVIGEQHTVAEPDNSEQSDDDGETEFTNPDSIAGSGSGSSGDTSSGKRRGRKPGSRNKRSGGESSRNTSKTTDSIAAMLFTTHTVAAAVLKLPMLKIPKEGCSELAAAILEVTELYEVPLLSEKSLAWLNLASVATRVYIFDGKAIGPQLVKEATQQRQHSTPLPDFMVK